LPPRPQGTPVKKRFRSTRPQGSSGSKPAGPILDKLQVQPAYSQVLFVEKQVAPAIHQVSFVILQVVHSNDAPLLPGPHRFQRDRSLTAKNKRYLINRRCLSSSSTCLFAVPFGGKVGGTCDLSSVVCISAGCAFQRCPSSSRPPPLPRRPQACSGGSVVSFLGRSFPSKNLLFCRSS